MPLTRLDTPVVVIDEVRLDRNIARLAASARARGLALRPHVKTHKVPAIAARQLIAGAAGITVATIGEAEVFADAGADDIFIAYPLWPDEGNLARLLALAGRVRLRVGTDSAQTAVRLAPFTAAGGSVSIELDSGHHRSGVLPEDALAVAESARDAGTVIDGLFTFPGHGYAPGATTSAAEGESEALGCAAGLLHEAGFTLRVLSGGSTPTAEAETLADEIRPGVYVFGDAQQWELGRTRAEDIALTVHATVVSRHDSGDPALRRVVLDAGSKVLGGDRPAWATGFARLMDHPEARVTALSEHHATVVFPAGAPLPALGERLRVVPNHVCLTMNLVDEVHAVGADGGVGTWQVTARGRNS